MVPMASAAGQAAGGGNGVRSSYRSSGGEGILRNAENSAASRPPVTPRRKEEASIVSRSSGGSHRRRRRCLVHSSRRTRVFRVEFDGDVDGSEPFECEGHAEEKEGRDDGGPASAAASSLGLGGGGVSTVFAVKMLSSQCPDAEEVSRLYNEYHVISGRLKGISCVRKAVRRGRDDDCWSDYVDVGNGNNGASTGSCHATVLEWVEGPTFREWLRRRPVFRADGGNDVDWSDFFEKSNILRSAMVLRDTAEALALMHDAGVEHNDVTADNIIVCRDDAVGLRATVGDVAPPSRPLGVKIIGLGYASVTHALEVDDGGDRVNDDLYNLGVLFLDALAREPPEERRCSLEESDDEDDGPVGIPGLDDPASKRDSGFIDLSYLGFTGDSSRSLDSQMGKRHKHKLDRVHPRAPRPLAKVACDLMEIGATVQKYELEREVVKDLDELLSDPERFLFLPPGQRPLDHRPEEVYGREEERKVLVDAYRRVAGSPVSSNGDGGSAPLMSEAIFVSGPSGVGKSHLVKHTLRPRCQYFVSGKFDQYRRTEPYSALLAAFSDLCDIILEDGKMLGALRSKAMDAIGIRGVEILTEVLPGLRDILGEDTSSVCSNDSSKGGGSAHSRCSTSSAYLSRRDSGSGIEMNFDEIVRSFLRVVCGPSMPIVLFLDDLHWADGPSLRLIHSILTDTDKKRCRLLFIGTYRSNDVEDDPDHPLIQCIEVLESRKIPVTRIDLPHLDRDATCSLVSSELRMTTRLVRSLADLVHRRTQGNPLFSTAFLEVLHSDGLLRLDSESLLWTWDVCEVRKKNVPEDVVQLLTDKILRLRPALRETLQMLAFIGMSFEASTIKLLSSKEGKKKGMREWSSSSILTSSCTEEKFAEMLLHAIDEGLIDEADSHLPLSLASPAKRLSTYSIANSTIASSGVSTSDGGVLSRGKTYRFAHDRVRQAAYSLVAESDRPALHLRIGELIWQNANESQLFGGGSKLFLVVDQLNKGSALMDDPERRDLLAALNLRAGERALQSSASTEAAHYFFTGFGLLGEDGWDRQYELALALMGSCAEADFRSGDYAQVEVCRNVIFQNCQRLHDRVPMHLTLIKSLGAQDRMMEGIDVAFGLLAQLGESFPKKVSNSTVVMDLAKTMLALRGKSNDDILGLPDLEEERIDDVMRVISLIFHPVYLTRIQYLPLLMCRIVRLSLKYGACEATSFAIAHFGTFLCGVMGDYEGGYRYGQLGLSLLERFKASEWLARVYTVYFPCIDHWRRSIKLGLGPLKDAYRTGLKSGDLEYSMLALVTNLFHSFYSGESLQLLEEKSRAFELIIRDHKQERSLSIILLCRQAILNLMGRSSNTISLTGDAMDEKVALEVALKKDNATDSCMIYMLKMLLAAVFGEYDLTSQMAKKSCKFNELLLSTFGTTRYTFYDGLASFAVSREKKRSWAAKHGRASIKKFQKWAKTSPDNHSHALLLLKAEHAALKGNKKKALRLYDSSIDAAGKNGFIQDEALAIERAGLLYRETGNRVAASRYFTRAHACYKRWGADAKAEMLREKYCSNHPPAKSVIGV